MSILTERKLKLVMKDCSCEFCIRCGQVLTENQLDSRIPSGFLTDFDAAIKKHCARFGINFIDLSDEIYQIIFDQIFKPGTRL